MRCWKWKWVDINGAITYRRHMLTDGAQKSFAFLAPCIPRCAVKDKQAASRQRGRNRLRLRLKHREWEIKGPGLQHWLREAKATFLYCAKKRRKKNATVTLRGRAASEPETFRSDASYSRAAKPAEAWNPCAALYTAAYRDPGVRRFRYIAGKKSSLTRDQTWKAVIPFYS